MHKPLLLLVGVVMAMVAVFGLTPPNANAASQTANLNFSGSGSATTLVNALAVCDPCAPDILFNDPTDTLHTWGLGASAKVTATASWSAPASAAMQYSAGNLRHGATLDLSDTLTPGAGTITVNYLVTGNVGVFGTPTSSGIGDDLSCASLSGACGGWVATTDTVSLNIPASDTIPCTMPLPGSWSRPVKWCK